MPVKQDLTPDEKINLVRRCLAGEFGVREAGRQAGVSGESVRIWIDLYESEGVEGFLPRERNRVYSLETKLQAVQEYLSVKGSYQDISKKIQTSLFISTQTLDKEV